MMIKKQHIKALLLECLRVIEINMATINYIEAEGIDEIPESIYYQQLSRIPESVNLWTEDNISLLQTALVKDLPYSSNELLTEYDYRELDRLDTETVMQELNRVLEYYTVEKIENRTIRMRDE